MMKTAVKFTFFYLLIVAGTGVWMRSMPFLPELGLPFEHLRHAHSHLAFLGWVYAAFMLAMSAAFLPKGVFETPPFQRIFWLTQLSACCMFAAFLGQGYGAVSIAFLTLHTAHAYLFFGFFIKKARLCWSKASTFFVLGAIFSFILSSLGPFAIPFITVFADGNPVQMKMAIHFYLHFHYNGWFVFALLAVLFKTLENESLALSLPAAKWQFGLMFAGLFPAYFLLIPFVEVPEWATALVEMGLVAQWLGMVIFAAANYRKLRAQLEFKTPAGLLLPFSFGILFVKYTVELLTLTPALSALAKSANHFLTIGWLHLLFLGCITPFLWWVFEKSGWATWRNRLSTWGFGFFLVGFIGSEILLFATGLGYFVANLPLWLLTFSALIFGGVLMLSPGIFIWNKTQNWQGGPAPAVNFDKNKIPHAVH